MTTKDRIQQVKTTKERHGDDHYKKIGKTGGKKSSGKFDSDKGRAAVQRRWAKWRAEQAKKARKEKQHDTGIS